MNTFVAYNNVEFFALPPHHHPKMYVSVPSWRVGWEPSRPLLVPSPYFSAYYSGLLLHSSTGYKGLLWQISTKKFLVPALISFVAVFHKYVLNARTADQRIIAEGLGVLLPMLARLARWITDIGFFPNI